MRAPRVQSSGPATSATAPPRRAADGWQPLTLVLFTAVCIGVAATIAVTRLSTFTLSASLLLTGALAAGIIAAVVITEYEWFIVLLLLVRPSLDGVGGEGLLTPAVILGAAFLFSSVAWLAAQHAAGVLVRPSRLATALLVLAGAFSVSTLGSPQPLTTVSATVRLLAGALMFLVVEQVLHQRPKAARPLLVAFFASFVVPAGVALHQQLAGQVVADQYNGRAGVQGTFVHPNPFATYLVLAIVAAVALRPIVGRRAQVALLLVIAVDTPLLILTYTRIAWVALIVAVVYLAVRQDRRLFIGLGVGAVVAPVLFPSVIARIADLGGSSAAGLANNPNSMSWRFQYWGKLLPLGGTRPITGVGFGMVEHLRDEGLPPHNVIVQAFVEGGLLALAALCVCVWAGWRDHVDRVQSATEPRARTFALIASATGLSLIVQVVSENLLTETATLWAMALLLGVCRAVTADPDTVVGVRPDAAARRVGGQAAATARRTAAAVRTDAVPSP